MALPAFLLNRQGNVAVAAAILAVPLMLAAGGAVDITNMTRVKSDVQAALDVASMEIATNIPLGYSNAQLQSLGDVYFKAHLEPSAFADGTLPSLVYYGMVVDEDGRQTISTGASYSYQLLFGRSLGSSDQVGFTIRNFDVTAGISAALGDEACVYALSRSAPRAVYAGGNTQVTMDGCVIASNSSAADAIYVGGSAQLSADCLQSSGGIAADSGLVTDCPNVREHAWPAPDPFASLVEPVPPILYPNPKASDTIVQPGRYSNLTLSGTQTLEPGLYYIEGSLSIKGDITGTGVTFFMKDGGVTVNGNASLHLSAPQTGDYAGMLFMASRSNTSANIFNGNGATELDGYLYFPKGEVTYTGNNATVSTCLRIVADTIDMSGSSTLASDCTDELGGREARVSGPLYYSE